MQDKQGSMLLAHNGGLRASLYLLLGGVVMMGILGIMGILGNRHIRHNRQWA